jgi:prepilin-type processing-associated H-X9-DG protein
VACSSNLKQIGIAMMAYASDNSMHLPSYTGAAGIGNAGGLQWDQALTNGYVAAKCFWCPSDRYARAAGALPRTYAFSIGGWDGATVYWNGPRLTCSLFSNPSDIVILSERLNPSVLGAVGSGNTRTLSGSYVISAHFPYKQPEQRTNYLFLDGHVSWMETVTSNNFPIITAGACNN